MRKGTSDVSNSELLEAVNAGFNHMEERFQEFMGQTDRRFKETNRRFDETDLKFKRHAEETNRRLDETNQRIAENGQRIEDVNQRVNELYDHVDGFITLHQKLDQEIVMERAARERLEERITTSI